MLKRLIIPLQDCMSPNFNSTNSTKKVEDKEMKYVKDKVMKISLPKRKSIKQVEDKEMKNIKNKVMKMSLPKVKSIKQAENKKMKHKKDKVMEVSLPKEKSTKQKPMTVYESMIQKNREEKMAFLKSLCISEVEAGLSEFMQVKRKYAKRRKVRSEAPPVLRKSSRFPKVRMNLSERSLYKIAFKRCADTVQENTLKILQPEMTFKEALESEDLYESYKVDVRINDSEPEENFPIYTKSLLDRMTVRKYSVAKVTPVRITALTWYPSSEHMIVAAGDLHGQLGIWNLKSRSQYVFKIHLDGITNLQFNPFNQTRLISSSYDSILRCGDMVQHKFSELYNGCDGCTYFDVLSATSYLVAQKNGRVALVDERTGGLGWEKTLKCHELSIETISIHPIRKHYFITAGSEGSIRLWDSRKLQTTPVADITHHKSCVNSAFFSPVRGNRILSLSADDSISIFDSKYLKSEIKVKAQMKHDNNTGRWMSIFRATWLPNSDTTFVVGSMMRPQRIEVYDENMSTYSLMEHRSFRKITSTNVFHPTRPALAGGNAIGKVVVFT